MDVDARRRELMRTCVHGRSRAGVHRYSFMQALNALFPGYIEPFVGRTHASCGRRLGTTVRSEMILDTSPCVYHSYASCTRISPTFAPHIRNGDMHARGKRKENICNELVTGTRSSCPFFLACVTWRIMTRSSAMVIGCRGDM